MLTMRLRNASTSVLHGVKINDNLLQLTFMLLRRDKYLRAL